MVCFDNLADCCIDYSENDIFDIIKDYDEILLERDDGQAMWNISGPTLKDAEKILSNVADGCKIELKVYFDENGNNISDDDARKLDDFESDTILSIQPEDYEY